jgi:tetratricopeptide (TPR) repeat protein
LIQTKHCPPVKPSNPQFAQAHSNLGKLLDERGDKAGAEAAYRAAIAADPQQADAHYNLGALLDERGDKAGAETAYRTAIAAGPEHGSAHCNLGVILFQREDLAGAARLFAAALKIDPSHANAKANLQRVLRQEELEAQLRAIDQQLAQRAHHKKECMLGGTNPGLRFGLGAAVECNLGTDVGWTRGEVVAHDYREDAWDLARVVPYQVRLCPGNNPELNGILICAPMDDDAVIRAAGGASAAGIESAPE